MIQNLRNFLSIARCSIATFYASVMSTKTSKQTRQDRVVLELNGQKTNKKITTIQLIKKLKNHLYNTIDIMALELESNRIKMIWLSAALFTYSIVQGISNPSATASIAIEVSGGVFGLIMGYYVGTNTVAYYKNFKKSSK